MLGAKWILVAALGIGAAETILIKKDLGELCREAEIICEAEVKAVTAAWNADRTLIWTESTLQPLFTHRGESLAELKVMEPGGIVGSIGQSVEGMARYVSGERVFVFLKRDTLGQWRTHGCLQGRFACEADRIQLDAGLVHVHGAFFRDAAGVPAKEVLRRDFVAQVLRLVPGAGK